MLKVTKNKQRDLWMVDARKIGGKRKGYKVKKLADTVAKNMWQEHVGKKIDEIEGMTELSNASNAEPMLKISQIILELQKSREVQKDIEFNLRTIIQVLEKINYNTTIAAVRLENLENLADGAWQPVG